MAKTVIRGEDTKIEYLIRRNACYRAGTSEPVINLLENAIEKGCVRMRFFYGDAITGKDWLEECDIIGYVSTSRGRINVPILLNNRSSRGGGQILTQNIVKITIDKKTVYRHPEYHIGRLSMVGNIVFLNGVHHANCKTHQEATNYIKFLKGERNKI